MINIVRAWKDETYRQSLSTEEQAMLPASPAGEIELTEAQLEAAFGGWGGYGDDCYGGGYGKEAMRPRKATNEIDQDVDARAFATYNDSPFSIVVRSRITCTARADADLVDITNIKKGSDGYC
jgi:mersacidin/lichenicidin family type 2 lantibiotic